MLKWLMHRGIAAFERQWSYDASYVHEMIEADPRAAWMFQRATGLGKYRRDVPADALAAAAITAVRHEDCGPCTQLGVSMAERAGVNPKVLRAVLFETPCDDAARCGIGLAVHARDARSHPRGEPLRSLSVLWQC